ncbi:MAG: iron-siderophore ABC transporter substrate-binding protein [Timaviella obliquedivisa GSE-PSE-MK23-08B]|jgi:iron complex transport system substrate-binding protein|nr:iron-siderophore ABC transporter substrate-binding protein [Timaviella obliquedivisa GSE-PSE-MK23-08B]
MVNHDKKRYPREYQKYLLALLTAFFLTACYHTLDRVYVDASDEAGSPCRVIQHILGKSCVPVNPQRVVALDLLDNVLALGVKPVGATVDDGRFRTLLPMEKSTNIKSVGDLVQPNLESILQLQPDLILDVYWGQSHHQLSQIAPIVSAGNGETIDWKAWLKTYGEALGKQQEADALIADYHKRITSFQQKIGKRLSQTQVSVVVAWDNYRIYMKRSFSGQILSDIGLPRPPLQDRERVNENLSLELIPKMAGDVIFVAIGGNNPSSVEKLLSHPLWLQLKAVKEGRVYLVDAKAWLAGYGPVGANVVLDDLFKYLIDEWN